MILKQFCWCCDLRIGAIFIGITQNLIALPALVLSFLSFGYRQEISRELHISDDNHIIQLITLVLILCSFLKFCSCILLISGASRRSHVELMPWLIIEGFGIFLSYVIMLIFTIFAMNVGEPWDLAIFSFGNLMGVIFIYWWLCVYSLYHLYEEEESNKLNDTEQLILQ